MDKAAPRRGAASVGDELELKYAVTDLAAVEAFLDESFPMQPGDLGWRELTSVDRIFDTADRDLLVAGYGARLRRTGGQVIVGLKADVAQEGGLHHRRELEAEATSRLAPASWPASEARDIVLRVAVGKKLHERFRLRQKRRERAWASAAGTCLFSLDLVRVYRGRQELAVLGQLEVELRSGDVQLLHGVDRTILASGLAVHEQRSKLAIAAELVEGAGPLRAHEPFAEAGRRVLRRHLERMLQRERETRAGDQLALKQMRVATRRMRATWRLFDGAYRRADQRRYLRELRRVGRRLGDVRDLDVLLDELPGALRSHPLADTWRARRQKAWRRLLAMLDGDEYATFTRDYREFTRTPGLAVSRALAGLRVRDAAASRIWAFYERFLAHEPALPSADVATLHALRIDGKRLRYALETFADMLPPRSVAELIKRLTGMQDHLGALNDADVAAASATAWLDEEGSSADGAARDAVEAYLADRRNEIERLRADFAPIWREVGGSAFRRLLSEALGRI